MHQWWIHQISSEFWNGLNGHLLPQPIVSVNKIIRSIFLTE